ncbi:MAG: hypothetical protein LBF25_03185 [Puniceicoccales bacterium]|jgi:peptidoglycan hydrolase CwlO-like protein|nr:hypothetical protein [Puniceicoccales bacterium]
MGESAISGQFGGIGKPVVNSLISGTFQNVTTGGVGKGLSIAAGVGADILKFTKELHARVISVAESVIEIGRALVVAYPAAAAAIFVVASLALYCGYKHTRKTMAENAKRVECEKQKASIQGLIGEIQGLIDEIQSQIQKLNDEAAVLEEEQKRAEKELSHLNSEEEARLESRQQSRQNAIIDEVGNCLIIAAGVGIGILTFAERLNVGVASVARLVIGIGRFFVVAYPAAVAAFVAASVALYCGYKYVQHARETMAEGAERTKYEKQRNLIQGRTDYVTDRIDKIQSQIQELEAKAAALEEKRRAAEGVLNRLNSEEKARLESLMGGQQQEGARPQRRARRRRRQAPGSRGDG